MAASRNSPCSCGSNKRYKHCCGKFSEGLLADAFPRTTLQDLKFEALRHQRANELDLAERCYRQILAETPRDPDCLHMLGIVCLQTARSLEAVRLILEAAELMDWQVPEMQHNLGLALYDAEPARDNHTLARRIAYQMWLRQRAIVKTKRQPLVSVVIPSYCHATYIVDCLNSVYEQTYRSIELIVIDDGSSDGSPAIIEGALRACPFPYRFIARENRGAHATINEGVALAAGEFINVLNSDDRFSPDRIRCMVEEVCCIGAEWGFSNVQIIDGFGEVVNDAAPGTRAADLERMFSEGPRATTFGFGLLKSNFAVATGNLFVSRELFLRLGGFSDLRYNHDWEFALKATLESEPVYLSEKLYFYRLHEHNTIAESSVAPRKEANAFFLAYFHANNRPARNPFAPCEAYWGKRYLIEQTLRASDSGVLKRQAQALADGEVAPAPALIASLTFLADRPEVVHLLDCIAESSVTDTIAFDQAQRYGVTAMAIEALRQPGQTFSILEVGASRYRRLGSLLPQDRIIYLDLEIPEDMKADSDVVEGDATALAFFDESFDVVVALDVLEHIPVPKRRDFLSHTTRVARLVTIIAAPFDNPGVRAAEKDALAFWNRLMLAPYRWLEEHLECGLPDLTEMQALLTRLGLHHWSIGHGHLDLWRDMLKGHFSAEATPELRPAILAMDGFYGKRMLMQDFSDENVYRSFLFCSRDADVGSHFERRLRNLMQLSASSTPPGAEAMQVVLRELQNLAVVGRSATTGGRRA